MNPGDVVAVKVAYCVHPTVEAEIRRSGPHDTDVIAIRCTKVAPVDSKHFEYVEFEESLYRDEPSYAIFKFESVAIALRLDHVISGIVSQPLTIDEVKS